MAGPCALRCVSALLLVSCGCVSTGWHIYSTTPPPSPPPPQSQLAICSTACSSSSFFLFFPFTFHSSSLVDLDRTDMYPLGTLTQALLAVGGSHRNTTYNMCAHHDRSAPSPMDDHPTSQGLCICILGGMSVCPCISVYLYVGRPAGVGRGVVLSKSQISQPASQPANRVQSGDHGYFLPLPLKEGGIPSLPPPPRPYSSAYYHDTAGRTFLEAPLPGLPSCSAWRWDRTSPPSCTLESGLDP